jgi:hypothetical protein
MPKLRHAAPKYRHHKPSGQAVVNLDGVDHYLDPWKSKASNAGYDCLTGERLANGRRSPTSISDAAVLELANL